MLKNQKFLYGLIGFLFVVVVLLATVVVYLVVTDKDSEETDLSYGDISSFEECIEAGYPAMESYPRKCAVPEGETFTEVLEEVIEEEDDDAADDADAASGTSNLKVFFAKNPDSNNDFTQVFSVFRTTSRVDVGTFVIEELIEGPTAVEEATGLFTPIDLAEVSNCGGDDFSLVVDAVAKEATLTFCKQVQSAGVGDDARVISTVEATLEQFPTVDTVVILTKDNHCFGDESGLDLCI